LPNQHHIQVTKTARYFTLGHLGLQTKEVWLVMHGYAQLAAEFIKDFEVLSDGTRFIVAPEGLNKFYARGFGGKPAATWMTSEDREAEITDYINYLTDLYQYLDIPLQVKVVVLGFSQGVATASRFIHHTNQKIDAFVVYAGEIASELVNPISNKIKCLPVTYITGINDPFITPEKHQKVHELMHQLQAKIIEFDGGHEIKKEVLLKLNESIN
jgi:predicted esterase